MAVGVPVVSFGVGGVGEYLRGARDAAPNGVVVDSAEPRALADALIAALEDPDGRAALGASARAAVLADFRVEDQLAKSQEDFQQFRNRAPDTAVALRNPPLESLSFRLGQASTYSWFGPFVCPSTQARTAR